MNRKKRHPTRRRTALRQTAAAIALLLLLGLLNGGSILPAGVLRSQADRQGCGAVRVVKTVGQLPVGRRCLRLYLSANDNAVMMSTADLSVPWGWMGGSGAVLDCSGEGSRLHTALWTISHEKGRFAYFFGRVDDPEIQEVSFVYGYRDADGDLIRHPLDTSSLTSRRADWARWGGRDYFVIPYDCDDRYIKENPGWFYPCVDGVPVSAATTVDSWTGTSLGD